jgi:hypothetical protein
LYRGSLYDIWSDNHSIKELSKNFIKRYSNNWGKSISGKEKSTYKDLEARTTLGNTVAKQKTKIMSNLIERESCVN